MDPLNRPLADRIAAACLDLLYPPHCVACDVRLGPGQGPVTEAFCLECALGLEPVPAGACARCADPALAGPGGKARLCPRCRQAPPPFDAVLAAGLHGGPLLEAIHALKYDRRVHVAGPLARLLVARVRRALDAGGPPLVVVPVPLHPRRLRERGFDQAERLAEGLAHGIRRPVFPSALWRRRATVPQASLGRPARAVNLEGAFAVTRGARGARRVRGAHVLLVDDVLTTGATAAAAAAPLKAAGAARVTAVVLARAE